MEQANVSQSPPARKLWPSSGRQWVDHAGRTAVAATLSLLVARYFRIADAYWSAITTIIILQSTLGAALTISGQRIAGTALGAVAGALLSTFFGADTLPFAAGVFVLGLICWLLRLDRAAYRFAGITLAITMLVASAQPAWEVAIHRFVAVSFGIVVGLAMTALWPEPSGPAPSPDNVLGTRS